MKRSFGKLDRLSITNGLLRPIARHPSALCVWLMYSSHASDVDSTAYLAEDSIAQAFELSPEAIRKARRILEATGLLVDTGRRERRCKVYRLMSKPTKPQRALGDQKPRTQRALGDRQRVTPTSVERNPNERTNDTPTDVTPNRSMNREGTEKARTSCDEVAVHVPKNPSPVVTKRPPRKPAPMPPIPPALNTPAFLDAWARWQQHRREIRKPLTPLSVKQQFAKLAALGAAQAVADIDKAISSGWTGCVFESAKSARTEKTKSDLSPESILARDADDPAVDLDDLFTPEEQMEVFRP